MTLGGATGPLSLCVPEVMVEPLLRSFQSRQEKMQPDKPVVREPNWHPAFEEVLVPITAHWNACTLTLAELSNLEIGSVLPLPMSILEQTSIVVGSEEKFIGTIGIEGERIAVSITSATR
jgi:flagellar motor switch protein FliM